MLLLVVVFFTTSSAVFAEDGAGTNSNDNSTIYVSTQGNDTWDGLSVTYNDSTGSGPKATINNATSTVTLNGTVYIANGIYNESGIALIKNMTLIGESIAGTVINGGNNGTSIFGTVPSGVTVTIENLTLINGKSSGSGGVVTNVGNTTFSNCVISNNTASSQGGAFYNKGTITLLNDVFSGNNAASGGVLYNYGGTCTVTNCTFNNNTANNGGAIYSYSQTLTVANSTFSGNTVTGSGGALNIAAVWTLTNCTFTNNSAGSGGAFYGYKSNNSAATTTNCTFIGNRATDGGAVYNKDNPAYGGVLIFNNCTFANNTATSNGGAINTAILTANGCTFANNTATSNGGAIYVYQSININAIKCVFTGNNATSGGVLYCNNGGATFVNSTLLNNTATNGGVFYSTGGTLNVTNNTIVNNTATTNGGVIYSTSSVTGTATSNTFGGNTATTGAIVYNAGSTVTMIFNRITENTGVLIYSSSGLVNATLNWWGSNSDPISLVSGNVSADPWIVLNVSASPSNVTAIGVSDVTADLTHDSNGNDTSGSGNIPDGIPVAFASTLGNITNGTTVNGKSKVTFTATGTGGSANVSAKVDEQTSSTTVNIIALTSVYVSPSGSDVTGDGTESNPYQTISKALSVLSTNGTIYLTNGTYDVPGDYNITISRNATLIGSGDVGTIISAGGLSNIFTVSSGVTATIENLSLINGVASTGGAINNAGTLFIVNVVFSGDNATSSSYGGGAIYNTGTLIVTNGSFVSNSGINKSGGAIYNNGGTVNVTNSSFTNNMASYNGAALYNTGSTSSLTVNNSMFSDNVAGGFAGAIYTTGGLVTAVNSTFSNNSALISGARGGAICGNEASSALNIIGCKFVNNTANTASGSGSYSGGAIYSRGSLNVTNSVFADNNASNGGAIYSRGTLNVTNSTFIGNMAVNNAGAIYCTTLSYLANNTFSGNTATNGGVFYITGGTLNITNNTFANNTATTNGGVIYITGGTLSVTNNTFANNTATTNGGVLYSSSSGITATSNTFEGNTATTGAIVYNAGSAVTMIFNRITENTGVLIYSSSGLVNATLNWWGSNSDPISLVSGNVAANPWIVLSVNASSSNVTATGSSDITVDLTHDSNGNDTSSQGNLPDGIPVAFATTLGNITNGTTVNGKSKVEFVGSGVGGVATITANVDQQNCSTTVNVITLLSVYVSPTGSDVTGDGSQSNPYQTISKAMTILNTNGTIYLENGTYNINGDYNINISRNMTVSGADEYSTIINPQGLGNVFTISSTATVTIENLTITNGKAASGGAIYNEGILYILNCNLSGNNATAVVGKPYPGGGAIYNTGTLNINNSVLNNNTAVKTNGGAIYNSGTINIAGSIINNNYAYNGGGAIDNYNYQSVTVTNTSFYNDVCGTTQPGGIDFWKADTFTVGSVSLIGCTFTACQGGTGKGPSGGALDMDDACTGSIINCTFINNTAQRAGAIAIYDSSVVNITGCTFIGNTAPSTRYGYGGAINTHNNSTTYITDCTFTGDSAALNGGAVSNFKSTTVITNCIFSGNTAGAYGAALDNDPSSILTVINSTFINNTAANGAVIENMEGSTLNMTGCTFINNTATIQGGVLYNDGTASATLAYNSFSGNKATSGTVIFNSGGNVIAQYNWWGSNNPGFSTLVSGTVNYSPWIYMTLTADPTTVNGTQTSSITVNFNNLFNGTDVTVLDPALGHIPDGSIVNLQTTSGTFNGSQSVDDVISNGIAATTLKVAGYSGIANITALTGNQTLSVDVTITSPVVNSAMTNSEIQQVIDNALIGDTITFLAGTYNNIALNVANAVNLVGEGSVLVGDGLSPVLNITGSNISVTGFNITNGASGIGVISANNVTINNNTISGNNYGVCVSNSTDIAVTQNKITGNTNCGITLLNESDDNHVTGNTISGNFGTGIDVNDSDNNIINGNTVNSNAGDGISVESASGNQISNNTIIQNTEKGINADTSSVSNNSFINNSISSNGVTVNVSNVDPTNGASNVAVNKAITITFGDNVQWGNSWIELQMSNGTSVGFTKSISGNILTITPTGTLNNGVKYLVLLHTGSVTDLLGNPLSAYLSVFTTTVLPVVSSVDPVNGAAGVANNKTVTVTFNKDVKWGNGWVELQMSNGTAVSFTKSIVGNTLTINPTGALSCGVKYLVLLHSGSLTDLFGNAISSYLSSFTVTPAPVVSSVDPVNGAVGVANNKTVTVTFNKDVKWGSGWIELQMSNGTSVAFTKSIVGNTLTINPTGALSCGVKYLVLLHTGSLTDLFGNVVSSYLSSFTVTPAPVVSSVDPVNGAVGVPTSKVITVTFNKDVKWGSGWVELQMSNGTAVSFTKSIVGNTLTITPTSALSSGVKYMILVHTGSLTDLFGNGVSSYLSMFTTKSA